MQIWGLERPMLLGKMFVPLQFDGRRPSSEPNSDHQSSHSPFFSKFLARKFVGCKLWISRQSKPQRKLEEMGCECIASVAVIYF